MKVYLVSFIFVFSLMVTLQMPAGAGIRMKIGSLHGREREENKLSERDYYNILLRIRIKGKVSKTENYIKLSFHF